MKESQGSTRSQLSLMIWTGLGEGRNFVNAAAADVMIALAGEAGTLSEIALALRMQKPVFALQAWQFLISAGFQVHFCPDPRGAVAAAFQAVGTDQDGFVSAPIGYPQLPEQSRHIQQFSAAVQSWSGSSVGS
jgi:hypothetical protein